MITGECLDKLIESAWRIVNGDPETEVFPLWREECVGCLSRLMGSDHYYTHLFKDVGNDSTHASVVAAAGVLVAAREQIAKNGVQSSIFVEADCPKHEQGQTGTELP